MRVKQVELVHHQVVRDNGDAAGDQLADQQPHHHRVLAAEIPPRKAVGRDRRAEDHQHRRHQRHHDRVDQETRDLRAAKVFESMGGYSPTVGIIGAVMGLIHVMGNLADPGQLGSGIAVAFVATIYGVAFANLLVLPIGNKLKSVVQKQTVYREMLLEGVLSIAEGENPRSIEMKLQGFID